jgi:hypothetical protein
MLLECEQASARSEKTMFARTGAMYGFPEKTLYKTNVSDAHADVQGRRWAAVYAQGAARRDDRCGYYQLTTADWNKVRDRMTLMQPTENVRYH